MMCGAEMMNFPETFEKFAEMYGFCDTEQVYTNGSKLIPVFRVDQWLEHVSAENGRACRMIHARWDDGECVWGCKCTACGDRFTYETGECWHYCPNCGARVL